MRLFLFPLIGKLGRLQVFQIDKNSSKKKWKDHQERGKQANKTNRNAAEDACRWPEAAISVSTNVYGERGPRNNSAEKSCAQVMDIDTVNEIVEIKQRRAVAGLSS